MSGDEIRKKIYRANAKSLYQIHGLQLNPKDKENWIRRQIRLEERRQKKFLSLFTEKQPVDTVLVNWWDLLE